MSVTETNVKYLPKRVRIIADDNPESPRQWDNVGKMVCWHRRYNLGDEQPRESAGEFLRNLAAEHVKANDVDRISDEHIARILDKHFIILPLFLMNHSGLSISTSSATFRACDSAGWDWGQVGIIYCTKERGISECTTVENAENYLRGEVKTYDKYLTGDVYGFIVEALDYESGDWEEIESCWGFYGDNPRENVWPNILRMRN